MKKILWVCNIPIPRIAEHINTNVQNIAGWLTGFANKLEKTDGIEFHYAFPMLGIKEVISGKVGNINYYAFSQPKLMGFLPVEDQIKESVYMRTHIRKILSIVSPDILHIFGTEYPHSLVAAEEFGNADRTVINIQGLTSVCWMHFNDGIPFRELKRFVISNIARGNLLGQSKNMKKRGKTEIKAIRNAGHIIGRTDWDEACVKQISPDIKYHFCNESLRDSFYEGKWQYDKCKKHSIFMSQAATPIKGLHFMIRALCDIVKDYPDAHLYIAGNDITKRDTIYQKLKFSSYAAYINDLIRKNNLEDKITFLGSLDEENMRDMYLDSHVFVCASSIENSPNSLGEAMILGMPCVSSDVGGVKNMMTHESEGYVYQATAPYMLSYYIKKIFADEEKAVEMGNAAKKHAETTHCRENNLQTLLKIYDEIYYS